MERDSFDTNKRNHMQQHAALDSGGASAEGIQRVLDGRPMISDHGDDLDLQRTLHESLAANANEELLVRTRSSSTTRDSDVGGPEAAGHAGGGGVTWQSGKHATPQLGRESPPCQSSSVVAGSLRDLLQNEGKQKWYFDSSEAAAQPWKRKKDAAEEDAPRSEADLVEVLAENDWCVTPPGYVADLSTSRLFCGRLLPSPLTPPWRALTPDPPWAHVAQLLTCLCLLELCRSLRRRWDAHNPKP